MSWKNAPARASVATARAMTAAIGAPAAPQRVDRDVSATMTRRAVLCCSNSRVTSGLKLVRVDCGQSIDAARSPGCQSRRPANSNPAPWKTLGCAPATCSRMRRTTTSSMSRTSVQLTSSPPGRTLTEWAPAR